MPVIPQSSVGHSFTLLVAGVNLTKRIPSDSIRITETGAESNAVMEFDIEYTQLSGASGSTTSWLTALNQEVELRDNTNNRRLFRGRLYNARRRHFNATGVLIQCTAVSADAILDRLQLPKWVSKRTNGTNMTTDREMVQNLMGPALMVTPVGSGGIAAPNATVASTNASMPLVQMLSGGSARDILSAIAEAAATTADPTARRFYVDFDWQLHYYKGSEGTSAPYRIGDADYHATVSATSGLVSFWDFKEASGTTVYDSEGSSNATISGGVTRRAHSLVPNVPQAKGTTFNGTTGYAAASGASLHQADGPWSFECWFKRSSTGAAAVLWSGGANDIQIGFNATDNIQVRKENVGDNFVSTATYTNTSLSYHLVVTRTPGTTTVYVNGSSISGTTTARTFESAAGDINIGRRSTGVAFFPGTVSHVAFYSAQLSAATVLAHYNDGITIVADDFEFETDVNSAGRSVYVRGGNTAGSGWVTPIPASSFVHQTFIIDRPQSTTTALRNAIGTGFMKREGAPIHSGRAVVVGFDGWRAGQTLTIDSNALGIPDTAGTFTIGSTFEIKQVVTLCDLGNGLMTYEIYFGALPWSGAFAVQRKRRK